MGNGDKSDNIEEFYYQVYGLTLRSNQPLPGLKFSSNKLPQVEINLTAKEAFEMSHLAEDIADNYNFSWQTRVTDEGNNYQLCFYGGGEASSFDIAPSGRKISVTWTNTPKSERVQQALNFLNQHLDKNGGLATYIEKLARPYVEKKYQYPPDSVSVEGWCSAHPCVSAAATNLKDFGEKTFDFLRQTQRSDGSWQGYWWQNDEYTTALATKALARKKNTQDNRRVQLTIEWAKKRIKPNGAVYSTVRGNDSPFATALCVQILNLADGKQETETLLNQAIKWLIQNQLSDGSWESSAMFRLPKPGNVNPELPPCHNFPDDKRLFTSATVLTALSEVKLEN